MTPALAQLRLELRHLENEVSNVNKGIEIILSYAPFHWQHIHECLFRYLAPTTQIDDVLQRMRRLERYPCFILF